jgi:putative membrane protein
MFLWNKLAGLKAFGQSKEQVEATKVLAANQGLYNGFLAAGLFLGVLQGNSGNDFKMFFLSCVIVAGVYGGFTSNRKILLIQAMPAAIGLILVFSSSVVE